MEDDEQAAIGTQAAIGDAEDLPNEPTMMNLLLCVTFACVACQPLGSARAQPDAAGGSVTLQSADSSIARAIGPMMQAWRQAVLKGDTAALVRVARPEAREGIAEALQDERSPLSSSIFRGGRSYRAFLRSPSIRTVVFEHHLIRSHNQAIGCFYTGDVAWPTNYIALQELADRRPVRCLDWVFGEEGEWFVSYSFGMPERGRRQ